MRFKTLARSLTILSTLLIAVCVGQSDELPRPGKAIDAGDSYRLKDGSRVVLHRVVNEVAIKHVSSKPINPVLEQAGVDRGQLVSLASLQSEKSNVIDLYHVEDSQAVERLLNTLDSELGVFPVLIDPVGRRRVIATDEIIVQFAEGTGGPQAATLLNQEGLEELVGPVPSARDQYLVRVASGPDKHALTRAEQVAAAQGVEWAEPNIFCELEFYFIPNDTMFTN